MRNVVKKRANIRKVVIFAYALRTFYNRSVDDLEKRFVFFVLRSLSSVPDWSWSRNKLKMLSVEIMAIWLGNEHHRRSLLGMLRSLGKKRNSYMVGRRRVLDITSLGRTWTCQVHHVLNCRCALRLGLNLLAWALVVRDFGLEAAITIDHDRQFRYMHVFWLVFLIILTMAWHVVNDFIILALFGVALNMRRGGVKWD